MSAFDRFVGVPYLEHGRALDGCDCWGLVWVVYRDLRDVELPSFSDTYVTAMDRKAIASLIARYRSDWQEIPAGQERPFDVILLRRGEHECHVGLVAERGLMLHVNADITSRIERYRGGMFARRIVGFFRYRSKADS